MRKCTRVHSYFTLKYALLNRCGRKVVKVRCEGGHAIVTRKDVARLAGVSEATVSRVLNGIGPIKEQTKEKVLQAAKALNYHPNAIAQSFARRRSGNLGVVLPFVPKIHLFSTYYFSEILSGIGQKVKESGYDLLLLFRSPDEAPDYSSFYRNQKVDACIILGSRDTDDERRALRQLADQRFPFCTVNQRFEGEGFNEVGADHVEGSTLAVKHLLDRGFRRIAFLNGPLHYSNSLDRLRGYEKAIRDAGLPVMPELLFNGNYSRKSGYEAAPQIIANLGGIDAVFAANDRMAIGLMQGLREAGRRPGPDIAVVGYDNSDAATFTDPPLTSVHVPFYEMGQLAASKLLDQLKSKHQPGVFNEQLRTELVIRQSSHFDIT
jgi:DNA-binding LacI/PurR family transcriptional regulator